MGFDVTPDLVGARVGDEHEPDRANSTANRAVAICGSGGSLYLGRCMDHAWESGERIITEAQLKWGYPKDFGYPPI